MGRTPLVHLLQSAMAAAGESLVRNTVTRRDLLKGAAAVGTAAALPGLWQGTAFAARQGDGSSPSVAVIGAGLAGLTAAYRLKQAGIIATVFEASDRLGGRCWTRRGDFADGQIAEHGGELIDTNHTQARQLCQELGLTLDNLYQAEPQGSEPAYYFDGQVYTVEEATNDLKSIWQKMHRDLSEASYPTLYNNYTQRGWELDHMSIIDWIEETVPGGMNSKLGQLLDIAYNIEYGGESSEQSSLNLLYLLGYSGPGRLRMFGPSNEKYHVRGGNDQIVSGLAAPISGQIQTGTRLEAIRRNEGGSFTLTLRSGAASREETYDHVIMAIPFSILRTMVDYSRAGFSPLKQTAIAELAMGTNTKLNVQFTDRHWTALGQNGESYSDTGYQCTWEVSRGQAGQSGILVNYTGGNYGATFSSGTPAQRAQQFLGQLEPVMPGITPKWNGKATVDYWTGYRWTRGSYSYWKVGQYTRFVGVEREREGNCHFAGEHTSVDFQGYLNGAIETGERAAGEVLGDLKVARRG